MQSVGHASNNVPLVRISLLNPFVEELKSRRISYLALLEVAGLPAQTPFPDDGFIAANAVYEFIEMAAEAARDHHLGARIGRQINLEDLPQFSITSESSVNVGDLLTRLIGNSQHHSTSVKMSLHIEPQRTTFGFARMQEP